MKEIERRIEKLEVTAQKEIPVICFHGDDDYIGYMNTLTGEITDQPPPRAIITLTLGVDIRKL